MGDGEHKDFRLQFESLYNALKQSVGSEVSTIRRYSLTREMDRSISLCEIACLV